MNSVHIQFSDGSSFDIPPDTTANDEYIATRYTAAIHSVQADPRKFSSSSPCVVCRNTSHSFDECDILNDIAFLKKHHIAYCSSQRRLEKMMMTQATVNHLATILEEHPVDGTPAPDFC